MTPIVGRRDFCRHVCQAATVTAIACASAGCGGDTASSPTPDAPPVAVAPPPQPPPTPAPQPERPVEPPVTGPVPPPMSSTVLSLPVVPATLVRQRLLAVTVDAASPLSVLWGAARTGVVIDFYPWDFLLTRTADDTITVLFATCTHDGCLVSQVARPIFVCPCHGSRYDYDGTVVQGPASAPLRRYPTRFVNGMLTIPF